MLVDVFAKLPCHIQPPASAGTVTYCQALEQATLLQVSQLKQQVLHGRRERECLWFYLWGLGSTYYAQT
jgi:hypothetical protein